MAKPRKPDLVALAAQYADEDRARETLEALRWPNGTICPKCGVVGESYRMERRKATSRARKGLWRCRACKAQFTVTVGTIFEDSHIPLGKWLMAIHLLCASKKGMSAHQLHRMLGVTYKSAWFMAHRIRYAMSRPPLVTKLLGIVEADETFVGGKPHNRHVGKREPAPAKAPVMALVERGGEVRVRIPANVTGETLREPLRRNVDATARIMTDGHASYRGLEKEFAGHEAVNHHEDEYVRGDAHTNRAENYFSILKRGIIGTYHHVGAQHLHRYLGEFDHRYNTRTVADSVRAVQALKGAEGKRLTYKPLTRRPN
jgi:transposase-like protein